LLTSTNTPAHGATDTSPKEEEAEEAEK